MFDHRDLLCIKLISHEPIIACVDFLSATISHKPRAVSWFQRHKMSILGKYIPEISYKSEFTRFYQSKMIMREITSPDKCVDDYEHSEDFTWEKLRQIFCDDDDYREIEKGLHARSSDTSEDDEYAYEETP